MAKTITITCNDDGSYAVSQDDQPLGEPVNSVDEVLGLVQQSLSDGDADDPKAAWDQEAAAREPQEDQPM